MTGNVAVAQRVEGDSGHKAPCKDPLAILLETVTSCQGAAPGWGVVAVTSLLPQPEVHCAFAPQVQVSAKVLLVVL